MSWWCLLCVEETACCTWYMPAASTDFHMDRIHCCPKLGFLRQHTSMLLSLILSPPNNFTVKYWPDSIIYKTWLCVITLVSKQFMVISMSILPALDKVNRYSLQISIQGEEEWRGLMKVQIVTSNPCQKPTAEERLKTRFWFIAAARYHPEILAYQCVGLFNLRGYVFSNLWQTLLWQRSCKLLSSSSTHF